MFYLYMLKSYKYKYNYVGTTGYFEKRFNQHKNGLVRSTIAWRPFDLVHIEMYKTLGEARKREWYLKCTPQGGKEKNY